MASQVSFYLGLNHRSLFLRIDFTTKRIAATNNVRMYKEDSYF